MLPSPAPPGRIPDQPGGAPIEADGLTKRFGSTLALDGVTLSVPAGSIVGLVGPSGCGKTTLLRVLTGVYRPTSGSACVLGADPVNFSASHRRRIGYQAQASVLFPHLSLKGNLAFVASLYGLPWRQRRRRLREVMDLVGLGEHRRTLLSDASGGMQRRLALAATLVHDPELVLLDEPTAGIDPILRERFWDHFRALRDGGRTMLVSTQYVGEATHCDLVAVMADGRLLVLAAPDDLRRLAYAGEPVDVRVPEGQRRAARHVLDAVPSVQEIIQRPDLLTVVVADAARAIDELPPALAQAGIEGAEAAPPAPDYDEVFVRIVGAHRMQRRAAGSDTADPVPETAA